MAEILFIDDEPGILRSLSRSLIDCEWECDFCEDPQQALKMIEENDYLVIVTDMKMPGMSGAEVLKKAQELSPLSTGVVLSAYADRERVLGAINEGHAWHYLNKPWENDELLLVLDKARVHSQQQREIHDLNHFLEEKVKMRTRDLEIREDILYHLLENENIAEIEQRFIESLKELCECEELQVEAGYFGDEADRDGLILLSRQGLSVGKICFSPESSRQKLLAWRRTAILLLGMKQVQLGSVDMDNIESLLNTLEGGGD